MKSIVTIGGGTGQITLLTGLKKYPVKLTAVVSMADDGGSDDVRQIRVVADEVDRRQGGRGEQH